MIGFYGPAHDCLFIMRHGRVLFLCGSPVQWRRSSAHCLENRVSCSVYLMLSVFTETVLMQQFHKAGVAYIEKAGIEVVIERKQAVDSLRLL